MTKKNFYLSELRQVVTLYDYYIDMNRYNMSDPQVRVTMFCSYATNSGCSLKSIEKEYSDFCFFFSIFKFRLFSRTPIGRSCINLHNYNGECDMWLQILSQDFFL